MNLMPLSTRKANIHDVVVVAAAYAHAHIFFYLTLISVKSFSIRSSEYIVSYRIKRPKNFIPNICDKTFGDADKLREMLRCFSIGTFKKSTRQRDGRKMPIRTSAQLKSLE